MELKFPKRKKVFKKRNFEPNADLYWEVILVSSFALMILSFVFGFILFRQADKDPVLDGIANSPRLQSVRKERIDRVLEHFSERQKKSSEILRSPSPIVDPSL